MFTQLISVLAAPAALAARHQAPILSVGTPSNGSLPAACRARQPLASRAGAGRRGQVEKGLVE